MKRSIVVQETNIVGAPHGFNKLRVEVYYEKGGVSFFGTDPKRRGYYASVAPHKQEEDGTMSVLVFSGKCQLIEEADRFSEAHLGVVASLVRDGKFDVSPMKQCVLAKNRAVEVE